jgi:hypothetical protein
MVEISVVGEFNAAMENKFNRDIAVLKKGDVVVFSITSHGGEVDTLKRMSAKIYAIKQMGVQVVTFVPEYAYSCGFLFFLLGDTRDIDTLAKTHYHAVRITLESDSTLTAFDLKQMYDDMQPYQEFCRAIFRESCNVSDEIFSLLEFSELPLNRSNLQTLGIIN